MEHKKLVCEKARILSNDPVGPNLYIMKLESPRIAAGLAGGQFVHMRVPGMEGHILRRPFSVLETQPREGTLEILYQDLGFGSHRMTELAAGQEVDQIGPVGHGWQEPPECGRALLVGGGVGAAPLFMQAKKLVAQGVQVEVVLGAQTEAALVLRGRYAALLGRDAHLATDDGSLGFHGFCTQPASDLLDAGGFDYAACCGPEPLMRAVAHLAHEHGVPCQVSMERRMACGIGACLSCVVDTHEGKRRACVDGPVFDAEEVLW